MYQPVHMDIRADDKQLMGVLVLETRSCVSKLKTIFSTRHLSTTHFIRSASRKDLSQKKENHYYDNNTELESESFQ